MESTGVKIKGLDKLNKNLSEYQKNLKYNPKLLQELGNYVTRDIKKMFSEGGDPKWERGERQGKTLLDTGKHLRDSISYSFEAGKVVIGTNSNIARVHNFGAQMKGGQPYKYLGPEKGIVYLKKGTSGPGVKKTKPYKMPKREFMFIRNKTVKGIIERIKNAI